MAALGIGSFDSELDTLKNGLGAFLLGTFITTFVVGMIIQQTLRYFRLYSADPLYMKIWVIVAVTMQLFTVALEMHVCYYQLVTHYLDPLVFLKKTVWSSAVIATLAPVNIVVSESFFARRVYMLGGYHRVVAVFAMTLIVANIGFFIPITVHAATGTAAQALASTGGLQPTLGGALLVAGELQLSGILVYYLRKSRTSLRRRTISMVDILIAYTISSGSLVCALNIASLVLSIADPHNIIFLPFLMVLQSVYLSSFIVALNTRQSVRSAGELDNTDIDGHAEHGGVEKGAELTDNRADRPMTSIVFAAGVLQTQASDLVSPEDDSSASSDTRFGAFATAAPGLDDPQGSRTLGTATV